MTLFEAVILGIVEGITEFLPVSSTAHLVLTSELLKIKQNAFTTAFDIIIQLAPIFSVMYIFKEKLLQSLDLWVKLIIAFIPTGFVGLFFHTQIEAMFETNLTLALMVITGVAFLLIEFWYQKKDHTNTNLNSISYKKALGIGLFQVLSLVPGVSRSGSTILGAMLLGLSRENAMNFSFLLAIPTMGAASGYMFLKEYDSFSSDTLDLLAVGFVVSAVVGYAAVKLFLSIVAKYSFKPFGIYLIASALLFFLFGVSIT